MPLLVRNFGKESDINTCGFVLATHLNLLNRNDIAACTLYSTYSYHSACSYHSYRDEIC